MNCTNKTYKDLYYNSLLLNHPFILFYQVSCLNYESWSLTKKNLQSKGLNFTRVKPNIFKKNLEMDFFQNAMNGPVIAIFINEQDNKFDISNINLGSDSFLLALKIKKKLYSAPKTLLNFNSLTLISSFKFLNKQLMSRFKQYRRNNVI